MAAPLMAVTTGLDRREKTPCSFIVSSARLSTRVGLVGGQILELSQIGAGAEGGSGAGEHDAAHAFVGFRGVQCGEQGLRERVIERVALVGPVHGEDAYASSIFGQQLGHFSTLNSNVCGAAFILNHETGTGVRPPSRTR